MCVQVGIYYGYPLAVYDEETGSYGYYTEEDAAEEGWKFNKFNRTRLTPCAGALHGRTGCPHQD